MLVSHIACNFCTAIHFERTCLVVPRVFFIWWKPLFPDGPTAWCKWCVAILTTGQYIAHKKHQKYRKQICKQCSWNKRTQRQAWTYLIVQNGTIKVLNSPQMELWLRSVDHWTSEAIIYLAVILHNSKEHEQFSPTNRSKLTLYGCTLTMAF